MGLWDYDEEVEACEVSSSTSSDDSGSEQPSPSRQKGRKRKTASEPIFNTPGSIDNNEQLPAIIPISDSDSDEDLLLATTKTPELNLTPKSSGRKKGRPASGGKQRQPGGKGVEEASTPDDRPESYLDKDTLQQLQQNDLRKLLEDDDLELPQPEISIQPPISSVRTYDGCLREKLTEDDLRVLASVRQNAAAAAEAATTSTAHDTGPASGEGGADEEGTKICISLQSKHGKIKIKISPDSTFQKLIERFKEHALKQGWLTEAQEVRLLLDGDVLDPEGTPSDQGLEDEDVVEARY